MGHSEDLALTLSEVRARERLCANRCELTSVTKGALWWLCREQTGIEDGSRETDVEATTAAQEMRSGRILDLF